MSGSDTAQALPPLTDTLARVLRQATEFSKKVGKESISTDFVFLAMIMDKRSTIRKILREMRVDFNQVANAVARRHGIDPDDLLPEEWRPRGPDV